MEGRNNVFLVDHTLGLNPLEPLFHFQALLEVTKFSVEFYSLVALLKAYVSLQLGKVVSSDNGVLVSTDYYS